jgi:hypothetical protein
VRGPGLGQIVITWQNHVIGSIVVLLSKNTLDDAILAIHQSITPKIRCS